MRKITTVISCTYEVEIVMEVPDEVLHGLRQLSENQITTTVFDNYAETATEKWLRDNVRETARHGQFREFDVKDFDIV